MLGDLTPSVQSLCKRFDDFLCGLTSDFTSLQPADPEEFLVSLRSAYKALRNIDVKKFPGSDPVPNVVWKEFVFKLSNVLSMR